MRSAWWGLCAVLACGCECSSGTLGQPCEVDEDCDGLEICDPGTDTCQLVDSGGEDAAMTDAGMSDSGMGTTDAGMDAGPVCNDEDGDGTTTCAGDCDDADALTSPTATDICGDGIDQDCDSTADDGCTAGIGTYVSQLTGLDTNPGTRAMPVQTIGQGIRNAMMIGGAQSVIVAEGTYAEKVTLVEGVDLLGGFDCTALPCTWARDPATNVSNIQNTDFEGVLAGAGITNATLIEGFSIAGMGGMPSVAPGSAGITLRGGAPTIRGNTIVGGNVTGGPFNANRSIGIALVSTNGALIENNDITGGPSVRVSTAITFDNSGTAGNTSLATVRGNVLRGGPGARSIGVLAWNSIAGTLLTDNDIAAGNSTGGASHGIEIGGHMTIDGNRINVDRTMAGTCTGATGWCAGIMSESSTTVITNNVVFGPLGANTAAVYLGEFERAAGMVVLNANYLNGGGSGPMVNSTRSAALVVSIGTCMMCGFVGYVGRVRNNILDGGNNQNRFGILEDPAVGRSMRPEILENNLFHFMTAAGRNDVHYRQTATTGLTTDYQSATAVDTITMPVTNGNIEGDPLIDATWHLMSGSPCIDMGIMSEAPATDFEGDARPSGAMIDIGHDET